MIKLARNQNKTPIIYVSKGSYKTRADKTKNPFTQDERMGMVKSIFPNVNVRKANSWPGAIADALQKSHKEVSICVGSNRVNQFRAMMNSRNVGTINGGTRNNGNTLSGVSGTKLRKLARNNNYTQYRKNIPNAVTNKNVRWQMETIQERTPAPSPSRKRTRNTI